MRMLAGGLFALALAWPAMPAAAVADSWLVQRPGKAGAAPRHNHGGRVGAGRGVHA